jgi:hypothetical protein
LPTTTAVPACIGAVAWISELAPALKQGMSVGRAGITDHPICRLDALMPWNWRKPTTVHTAAP